MLNNDVITNNNNNVVADRVFPMVQSLAKKKECLYPTLITQKATLGDAISLLVMRSIILAFNIECTIIIWLLW